MSASLRTIPVASRRSLSHLAQGSRAAESAAIHNTHRSSTATHAAKKNIMAGPRRTIDSYFRRMGPSPSRRSKSERGQQQQQQQQQQQSDVDEDTSKSDHRDPSHRISTTTTSIFQSSSSRRKISEASGTPTNNGSRAVHRYNQQQKRTMHNTSRHSRKQQLKEFEQQEQEETPAAAEEEEGGGREKGKDDSNDPYNLARFLDAQDQLDPETASPFLGTYADALRQLRRGRKTGHWVWYVFPQMPIPRPTLYSSGRLSEMSRFYGIRSLGEARAYLGDEVLGLRLREITRVVLDSEVRDGEVLMGGEGDWAKLGSCMTLFARAWAVQMDEGEEKQKNLFRMVLDKYFDGEGDALTEEVLDREER